MKALDENDRTSNYKQSANSEPKSHLLIDSPNHHYLLSPPPELTSVFIQDLFNFKKQRFTRQKQTVQMLYTLSLCISLLLVIAAFEWKFYDSAQLVDLASVETDVNELMDIPITQQPPPPTPKVSQPDIVEVPDEEVIEEEIEVDFDISIDEETEVEAVIFQEEVASGPEEEVADEIFTIVEQKPEPVGGMKAFYEYLGANLHYPPQARRMGIEGRVFVQFVVEKDGSLTDVQLVRGIGAGCDEEAIRVIENAPKWQPGKQRGQPVRVRNVMPILFRLVK